MFSFMQEYEIYKIINILGFILGLLFGIVAQKSQFCFGGSIKDYLLINSTSRGACVMMAIIVALISTSIIANINDIDLTQTIYYKQDINYFAIIFGGAMFGAGAITADGCSSRHLIKFAQGDAYSLVTLLFVGIFAYMSTKGILYQPLLLLTSNQTLLDISSFVGNFKMNFYITIFILLVGLWFLTKKISRILLLGDGVIVGILISLGWYITFVMGDDSMDRQIALTSMTFVYPTAQTLELFTFYEVKELTFGISVVLGVLFGAFFMSKINKKYHFGCTSNMKRNKLAYSMIGGAMMGVGGILAIGCTIGQGLTGLSTLAFASLVAISSIMISAYFTAKYFKKIDKLPMCFVFEWNDK